MAKLEQAEWWTIRRAQNRKPATYRCPLCGYQLHAMSEHVLIAPEGDTERRRHAHSECVLAAQKTRRLLSYDEWRKSQPRPPSVLSRVLGRARSLIMGRGALPP
jgi:hypothetical protein